MKVTLLGATNFNAAAAFEETGWTVDDDTDPTSGAALAEFAGRACYQSWTKPNPATATNAGYLKHILEVGHLSVLEHGTVTFYITGVSRSLTHELIRHRHFSYSQLSQRYVPADLDSAGVEPDIIAGDPELHAMFTGAMNSSYLAYAKLLRKLEGRLARCPQCDGPVAYERDPTGWVCQACVRVFPKPAGGTALKKAARQAARSVLPNAAETRIVVTGNYRAWRHFIAMRATEAADVEIRALAIECLTRLRDVAPNVFADFEFRDLSDGTTVAESSIAWES